MPAVSKQQRKFMGLVHAVQKGKVPTSKVSKSAKDAAKQMKKSDVEDFASTDEKGLPKKKNEGDLGLTYKKGKTVKVKHKTSGKSLIIIDKPNVRKEYEKIGFYAESVNEISGVDLAKRVLKNKSYEKGIDLQTANLIVTIDKAYDKNPKLQKKFRAIQLPRMKQLIMKYYG